MRLSLKERRMKSANAIKTYRKSGVAERRDLRFYGPFVGMFFDGAKRFADLSQTEGFIARSRRTPAMPVDRCSWELSGRKLHRKIKKSQALSEAPRRPFAYRRALWRGVEGPPQCLLADAVR